MKPLPSKIRQNHNLNKEIALHHYDRFLAEIFANFIAATFFENLLKRTLYPALFELYRVKLSSPFSWGDATFSSYGGMPISIITQSQNIGWILKPSAKMWMWFPTRVSQQISRKIVVDPKPLHSQNFEQMLGPNNRNF